MPLERPLLAFYVPSREQTLRLSHIQNRKLDMVDDQDLHSVATPYWYTANVRLV
jgi:hypothetical protein